MGEKQDIPEGAADFSLGGLDPRHAVAAPARHPGVGVVAVLPRGGVEVVRVGSRVLNIIVAVVSGASSRGRRGQNRRGRSVYAVFE